MSNNKLLKFITYNFFVQGVVASVFILAAVILYSCLNTRALSLMKEEQITTITSFQGNIGAVIGEGVDGLLEGSSIIDTDNPAVLYETRDCDLIQKEQEYYITDTTEEQSEQRIHSDYPIFIEQGASLYLYHENFTLYTNELTKQKAKRNTYLSQGMVFNQDNNREGNDNFVLLQLPGGLFINLSEVTLTIGGSSHTIGVNSIIKWMEEEIAYCNLYNNEWKVTTIPVTDSKALIHFGEKRFTYDMFFEHIFPSQDTTYTTYSVITEEYRVSHPLYQYFLGVKYEYDTDMIFLWTKEGYLMETKEAHFYLSKEPLYFKELQKVLLPCDYELVQPKFFRLNKLPAMTEVEYRDGVVYTSNGDKGGTFQNIVLFDGEENYLFFDPTTLQWGETEVDITPLSSVTVGDDGSIGIYNYGKEEYLQYQLDGYQEVKATVNNDMVFNLSRDIWYRSDGQEQILFSEPSLLSEVK